MLEEKNLFTIRGYRGTGIVDHKEVSAYLKSLPIHRRSPNPSHTSYQDIVVPEPFDPVVKPLIEDIVEKAEQTFRTKIEIGDVWSIIHGPYQQTYPHRHNLKENDWACVYWAQTPQPCALLECYPLGMSGPHIQIPPMAGDYLIFPGSLLHGVRENVGDDERISLSFNITSIPNNIFF